MHLNYSSYEKTGEHPQKQMKNLGITYQVSTPQSLGDCWWFWNCENIPEVLPDYLRELRLDPMNCIGLGLSTEEAESIRDYNLNKSSWSAILKSQGKLL